MIGGPVDLVVGDLSFISLRLVLEALLGVCAPGRRPGADGQAAVRGRQGAGRARAGWCGTPRCAPRRSPRWPTTAAARGWGAAGVATSPLPGPSGNVEFFLWLRRGPPASRGGHRGPRWRAPALSTVPGRGSTVSAPARPSTADAAPWTPRPGRPAGASCSSSTPAARPRARSRCSSARRWAATASRCACSRTTPRSSSLRRRRGVRGGRRRRRGAAPRLRARRGASAGTARSCGPPSSPVTSGTPLLGVNLGHVGLPGRGGARGRRAHDRGDRRPAATAPRSGSPSTCRSSRARSWSPPPGRSTRPASRRRPGERMLEVVVEIDGRPLSRWGCDGVVCSTPTGSTAYNFSAGGPIVWPEVQALLMVPISAHALFARPMVVAPTSVLAVEVIAEHRRGRGAVVRRPAHRRPAPGARIEVRRGHAPIRLARLHEAPFTDRLVAKFEPARSTGWRGRRPRNAAARGARHRCLRRSGSSALGVIDESVLELGPGFTAVTGETGAGKTMVVTALGLLHGRPGRLRRGAHGPHGAPGSRASCGRPGVDAVPGLVEEAGGELEDGRLLLARQVSAEGRSRAFVGGAGVPAACWAGSPTTWWPCTASPTSTGCCGPRPSATRSTASPARRRRRCATGSPPAYDALRAAESELAEVVGHRPRARPRGRPAALRARGDREGRPAAGGGRRAWPREEAGSGSPTPCGRPPSRPAPRCPPTTARPDALGAVGAARRLLDGVRDHDPEAAEPGRPAGRGQLPALRPRRRRRVLRRRSRGRPRPAGRGLRTPGGPTALTRKYGDTRRRGARPGPEASAARLLELDDTDGRIEALRERNVDAAAPSWPRIGAELSARAAGRRGRLGEAVTEELTALAMPHARADGRRRARRRRRRRARGAGGPGRRPLGDRTSTGVDEVELLLAANVGAEPRPLAQGGVRR